MYLSMRQADMLDAIVIISLGFLFLISLIMMIRLDKKEKMREK